jgi:hypothetical protein
MQAPGDIDRNDWVCFVCGTVQPWYVEHHCEEFEEDRRILAQDWKAIENDFCTIVQPVKPKDNGPHKT